MILAILAASAGAECPASSADLAQHVVASLDSFKRGDGEALQQHGKAVEASTVCLAAPLEPEFAPDVHLALVTRLYWHHHEGPWPNHLAAIKRLNCNYRLPVDLFPEGHPVRVTFEGLTCPTGEETSLGSDQLWSDGMSTVPEGPFDFTYLAQRQRRKGLEGRWVAPGEDFPWTKPKRTVPALLAGSGAALAIVGGIMVGGSIASGNQYYGCLALPAAEQPANCPSSEEATEFRQRTLVPWSVTGGTLLGVGLALGGTGTGMLLIGPR